MDLSGAVGPQARGQRRRQNRAWGSGETETKPRLVTPPSPGPMQATEENKENEESLLPDPDTRITGHPQEGDQGRKSRNTVQEEEKRRAEERERGSKRES